ncbi:unnamed protein product [Adineta steineri]|uniref:AIG1-type G domain-containing protein n=1 Tax=Adineta steineri TaxID=433720 RepID=A0A815KUN8_9BILA|nr:unnamed protein product [Adineta steineri]
MAGDNNNQFGLIILGNSGVGKSFLANILLGREAFRHEFSARSVTHRTEFQEITIDDQDYAIFNIPGLIEADQVIKNDDRYHRFYVCIPAVFQTRIDLNKREIDRAFTLRPNSLIIYVFALINGRMHNKDAVAFNAINKAYPLKVESLLLVVNRLPVVRPKNYEGETILLLQDILGREISEKRICFLNHINRDDIDERAALRNQLLSSIVELSPREHIKQQDICLQADEVAILKEDIRKMIRQFEENKLFFENEIREHQKRHEDLVMQQKAESERFQHIIDQQVKEAKEMEEKRVAEIRQMEERLRHMQAEHQRQTTELITESDTGAALIPQLLLRSQQAQEQLKQQITSLQNRPFQVTYRTRGKVDGCILL